MKNHPLHTAVHTSTVSSSDESSLSLKPSSSQSCCSCTFPDAFNIASIKLRLEIVRSADGFLKLPWLKLISRPSSWNIASRNSSQSCSFAAMSNVLSVDSMRTVAHPTPMLLLRGNGNEFSSSVIDAARCRCSKGLTPFKLEDGFSCCCCCCRGVISIHDCICVLTSVSSFLKAEHSSSKEFTLSRK